MHARVWSAHTQVPTLLQTCTHFVNFRVRARVCSHVNVCLPINMHIHKSRFSIHMYMHTCPRMSIHTSCTTLQGNRNLKNSVETRTFPKREPSAQSAPDLQLMQKWLQMASERGSAFGLLYALVFKMCIESW